MMIRKFFGSHIQRLWKPLLHAIRLPKFMNSNFKNNGTTWVLGLQNNQEMSSVMYDMLSFLVSNQVVAYFTECSVSKHGK
jgi:hypothetical protein